jgi:predicted ArsR family transcriptional regulator
MDTQKTDQIERLAVLAEPARRRLYDFVLTRGAPVGRDEAARALRIDRSLAAFHLDRLAEAGLLDTEYKRISGRTGPGAGRPAKLYRTSKREVAFSAPPRNYGLVARILSEAIEPDTERADAARRAARDKGIRIGQEAKRRAGARASGDRLGRTLVDVLRDNGFEPVRAGGEIRLRNCPFDALAADHRDLVCGMNLSLQEGIVAGLDARDLQAVFTPAEGMCCVAFRAGVPPVTRN